MKALSLKQPWAELILQGKKTIETRTWNTKFRGKFLIHASLTPNAERMAEFGFTTLPTGAIVGEAELVSVKEYPNQASWDADEDKHYGRLAQWTKKRYGYMLKNVKRVTPKPCKGMLNFFEVPW